MFAQARNPAAPLQSVEFLVTVGLLIGTLLAGALVIYFTDLWRKKQARRTGAGAQELSRYRQMFEDGELSDEEYRVIRDRLAAQIKAGVGVPAPVAAAPEAELPPRPEPPGPIS